MGSLLARATLNAPPLPMLSAEILAPALLAKKQCGRWGVINNKISENQGFRWTPIWQ